jgi:5,10-methenyltetrahydrofolate synthetase
VHRSKETRLTPEALRTWRKAERERLIAAREALPREHVDAHRRAIDGHLERGFPNLARGVVAMCWPIRNEYDPRFLAKRLRESGATTALPVVVKPKTPLVFREWHPGTPLARGVYDIPYPTDASPELPPDTAIVPMNGWDDGGYRLGYGGGFFDRTLAAAAKRPLVIGVSYELAHIGTIHPQPYDIPMDFVVTERGMYARDGERLAFLGAPPAGEPSALSSPVCYAGEIAPGYFGEDQPRNNR